MNRELKEIYEQLPDIERKALRKAIAENDVITINSYKRAAAQPGAVENIPNKEGKREAGRPNLGLTKAHAKERRQNEKQFRTLNTKEKISCIDGEEITTESLEEFRNHYNNIIETTCTNFFQEHEELTKKSPFIWYASLLYELKKNLPQIDFRDAARVGVAWDEFTGLMFKIGLFPTMEAFTNLTGIYKSSLAGVLTSDHEDLRKRIYNDCRDNIISQLNYNPMTQVNKIFIARSVYGLNENKPETAPNNIQTGRNVDDIPIFGIEDKNENAQMQ